VLNAVCPDGFEYHFVDEEFVVDLDLRPSNQYIFLSESSSCLRLEEMCVCQVRQRSR
jgi:hypothetical protein